MSETREGNSFGKGGLLWKHHKPFQVSPWHGTTKCYLSSVSFYTSLLSSGGDSTSSVMGSISEKKTQNTKKIPVPESYDMSVYYGLHCQSRSLGHGRHVRSIRSRAFRWQLRSQIWHLDKKCSFLKFWLLSNSNCQYNKCQLHWISLSLS